MAHDIMSGMDIVTAGPFHVISRTEVYVSTDPDDREIYQVGYTRIGDKLEKLYTLAKIALDRLMITAGIEEIESTTGRVGDRLWSATYKGRYIRPDGTEVGLTGTKEIDLSVDGTRWANEKQKNLDELLIENAKQVKLQKGQGERREDFAIRIQMAMEEQSPDLLSDLELLAEAKATRFVNSMAKFGLELAETGARTRAIRQVMQVGTYTLEQLKEPFIVYSSRFSWDKLQEHIDPETARKMLMATAAKELGLNVDELVALPAASHEETRFGDERFYQDIYALTAVRIGQIFNSIEQDPDSASMKMFGVPIQELTEGQAQLLISYTNEMIGMRGVLPADELADYARDCAKVVTDAVNKHVLIDEWPALVKEEEDESGADEQG